jgi:glycosyltransferase involved in cell wall biosynthesis
VSPDISVVIPAYNAARFIRGALASVLGQTRPAREIIVVDDASTDQTAQLVEEIAATAPIRVTLIRRADNAGGPALPLNQGLEAANGELVAILEQDDLMAPIRLERTVRAAMRHPECALIVGRPAIVTGNGEALRWGQPIDPPEQIAAFFESADGDSFVIPSADAFRALMSTNFIYSNSNVTVRRRFVRDLGGFDPRWPINSDADFEFRMLTAAPIAVVNAALCGYRSRPDSLYHARIARARVDGLLIRLAWGGKRWDWAPDETRRVYWALRAEAPKLWRRGDRRAALRVGRAIAASSAFRKHVLSWFGVGTF